MMWSQVHHEAPSSTNCHRSVCKLPFLLAKSERIRIVRLLGGLGAQICQTSHADIYNSEVPALTFPLGKGPGQEGGRPCQNSLPPRPSTWPTRARRTQGARPCAPLSPPAKPPLIAKALSPSALAPLLYPRRMRKLDYLPAADCRKQDHQVAPGRFANFRAVPG